MAERTQEAYSNMSEHIEGLIEIGRNLLAGDIILMRKGQREVSEISYNAAIRTVESMLGNTSRENVLEGLRSYLESQKP